MPYVKKSPIQEKLWELAEKVPGAKYVLPDPYSATSYLMPITGLTKQAISKTIVNKLFKNELPGVLTETPVRGLNKELSDLLKTVAATPRKAIEHIKEFRFIPGKTTSGAYHPEALSVFSSEFPSTMVGTYAHEVGHGASIPMLEKVLKRRGYPSPSGMAAYHSYQPEMEGVAEYLGKHLQEKAGVIPEVMFGHETPQKVVFEELSKMSSKNPYLNVYRYLQKIVR